MKTTAKQILFFLLFLCSCQEAAQNFLDDPLVLNDGSQNTILRRPKVTGVSYKAGAIVLTGERLDRITTVKLHNKDLSLSKKTESQVWAVATGNMDLFLNEVVSLVVNSAYGQSIIPIDVQLNAGSINSIHIANQSITSEDLADGAVTYSKISTSGATLGSYLKFNGSTWAPSSNGEGDGGEGSLGIQSLTLGTGIVGKDSTINNTGNISVNTGFRKDQILILEEDPGNYYGILRHKGPTIIDSSDDDNKDHSYLKFEQSDTYFKLKQNSNSLNLSIKEGVDAAVDIALFAPDQVDIKPHAIFQDGIKVEADGPGSNFVFDGDDTNTEFNIEETEKISLDANDTVTITSNDFIVTGASNFTGNISVSGEINITGNITADNLADFAEYFRGEEQMSPGDIVGLNQKNGLVRKYKKGDPLIGVVTTNPVILANASEIGEFVIPVGLVGQVPFSKDQVKIKKRVIYTKDNKRIGYLLNNGLLFLRIN